MQSHFLLEKNTLNSYTLICRKTESSIRNESQLLVVYNLELNVACSTLDTLRHYPTSVCLVLVTSLNLSSSSLLQLQILLLRCLVCCLMIVSSSQWLKSLAVVSRRLQLDKFPLMPASAIMTSKNDSDFSFSIPDIWRTPSSLCWSLKNSLIRYDK